MGKGASVSAVGWLTVLFVVVVQITRVSCNHRWIVVVEYAIVYYDITDRRAAR